MFDNFSDTQVCRAIEQWLEYGEDTFKPDKQVGDGNGHGGYFSGDGWAARCLRYHLQQLKEQGMDHGGLW